MGAHIFENHGKIEKIHIIICETKKIVPRVLVFSMNVPARYGIPEG